MKITFLKGKMSLPNKKIIIRPLCIASGHRQMSDALLSGKHGIVVIADLEGAFNTVWKKGTIYKFT